MENRRERERGNELIYYIGDLHFGHENVIKFDHRPFNSVEEMDKALIERWNQKVNSEDLVYVVGDFAYRNEKPFDWYLRQLKGKKYLIVGNHDGELWKDSTAMSYFEGVDRQNVLCQGRRQAPLYLSLSPGRVVWNVLGNVYVYGHIHNSTDATFQFMKTLDRAFNCGVAINGYEPITFQELERNNVAFKQNAKRDE